MITCIRTWVNRIKDGNQPPSKAAALIATL
jgi:hypothetical protein